MTFYRERPHAYALVFHYGLGAVVTWQLLEDLWLGQWKVYSGDFFPWRTKLDGLTLQWGENFYWALVAAESMLLVLYFLRIRLRWTAAVLAAILFVDGLGSFLNHRFLMALQLLAVSVRPVPRDLGAQGPSGTALYWNLDLVRWQVSLVYFVTALHKLNGQFLSGETLETLFAYAANEGLREYPAWAAAWLSDRSFCRVLAWATVGIEFVLAIGLNFQRWFWWLLPFAVGLHLSIAVLMPYIWIFTTQMLVTFSVFLPGRSAAPPARA